MPELYNLEWTPGQEGSKLCAASQTSIIYPRKKGSRHPAKKPDFSREFTKMMRNNPLLEWFIKRPMVVLLIFEGKCSCLRAKTAHFSGHLPTIAWI
jgi:hypothetical protein